MRARRWGLTRTMTALLLVVLALGAAIPAQAAPRQDGGKVERLLVFAAPDLTWADVVEQELPALEGFFADAALADMAPRSVAHRSGPGEAYLTISGGTRATSEVEVEGQVLALDEGDPASPAGEIFERRTGLDPYGDYVALGWPAHVSANEGEPYDIELGLLAERLERGDVETAVIGNADGDDSAGSSYERQAGLALADTNGVVRQGALTDELLLADPTRPYGMRLDLDMVMSEFRDAWGEETGAERSVVLVEASDLARTIRYRPLVDAERFTALRDEALREADALFAELLAETDPENDAVIVIAPYLQTGRTALGVAALRTPSSAPGYLRSATTQRTGIVSLVDVAPTVLDTLDLSEPAAMEGRHFEIDANGESLDERADHLVQIDEASRFRTNLLTPTTLAVVLALAGIVALGVGMVAGEWPGRVRSVIRFAVLATLASLPMSYVARAFPLEDLGVGFYWTFLVSSSLVVAALATLLSGRSGHPRAALVAVLVLMLAVLVGDVTTGSNLSLSAAFGYSPTGNSRLYGISNYSFGQVAAASCLLAALIVSAWDSQRGRWAALALLAATLVVLGVPTWGSDVGGVLAFTPALLVFAALVYRYRVRVRNVVVAGLATAAAVTAFGFADLARPRSERAHLGRLFERVGNEGLEPLLSIMERKFVANLEVSTESFWVTAVPIGILFWLFLARYPSRPLDAVKQRVPGLHAGLVAAAIGAALGSLVNDSGAIVGGVTVMVVTASLAFLASEEPAAAMEEPT